MGNEHYQHLMFIWERGGGKKVVETCRKTCAVYREGTIIEHVPEGNLLVQDVPCWPTEINNKMELVDTNPHYMTSMITDILQISKMSVENYLHQLSYVSSSIFRYHIKWMRLTLPNRFLSAIHCKNGKKMILFGMMTVDKKWTINNHVKCSKPPQTTSKAELIPKKVMLSVWGDWKGVVFHKLLPTD